MVNLKYEKTIRTAFHNSWCPQHFHLLGSCEIVLYANKTGYYGEHNFYLFDKHGNPTGRTVDDVCPHHHSDINLLPVTVDSQENICVSCSECEMIYLINPDENQNISSDDSSGYPVVYRGGVGIMRHGESGTLFTVTSDSGTVSSLNCTTTDFKLKCKLNVVECVRCMCHIASAKLLVHATQREL